MHHELPDLSQCAQFSHLLAVDGDVKNVFREEHDFHQGELIEPEVFAKFQAAVPCPQKVTLLGFNKTLDDAGYD